MMKRFSNFFARSLCPDVCVESITDINLDSLCQKGFTTVILDLDNTLLGWRSQTIPFQIESWLKKAEQLGLKRHIISNSFPGRVSRLSTMLGIPFISKAVKPRKKVFMEALRALNAKPKETVVIGDQLFTDILGGKRIGVLTILVQPIDRHEFFTTILFRIPEKILMTIFRRNGLLKTNL